MVGSIHSNTYGLPQPTLLTKSLLSTTPNPLPPPPPPLFTLKAYGVSIFFSLSFASTLPCFPLFEKSLHLSFFAIIHASPVFFGTYPHFKSVLSPPTYVSKKYPDTIKIKKNKKNNDGKDADGRLSFIRIFSNLPTSGVFIKWVLMFHLSLVFQSNSFESFPTSHHMLPFLSPPLYFQSLSLLSPFKFSLSLFLQP